MNEKLARYQTYLAHDPDNYCLIADTVVLMLQERHYAEAYALLAPKLSDINQDSSPFFLLAMHALHSLGRLDEALTIGEQLLATLSNDDATVCARMGLIYFDKQNYAQAKDWSMRALHLDEQQSIALTVIESLKAQAYCAEPAALAKLVERSPNDGRLWFLLAQAEMLALQFTRAEASLKRAIELLPFFLGAQHLLVWLYLLTDNNHAAQTQLALAQKINPKFIETLALQGIIDWVFKRKDNAQKTYLLCQRKAPEQTSVKLLAVLIQVDKNPSLASKQLDSLLAEVDNTNDKLLIAWLNKKVMKEP